MHLVLPLWAKCEPRCSASLYFPYENLWTELSCLSQACVLSQQQQQQHFCLCASNRCEANFRLCRKVVEVGCPERFSDCCLECLPSFWSLFQGHDLLQLGGPRCQRDCTRSCAGRFTYQSLKIAPQGFPDRYLASPWADDCCQKSRVVRWLLTLLYVVLLKVSTCSYKGCIS